MRHLFTQAGSVYSARVVSASASVRLAPLHSRKIHRDKIKRFSIQNHPFPKFFAPQNGHKADTETQGGIIVYTRARR